MNRVKISIPAMILLALLVSLSSIAALGADYPMTITDSAGREVTLQMPVERIIVTNSDAASAVVMLGAADKVVGISESIKNQGYYFPELKKKQSVGKWNALDYEMIGEIAKGGEDKIVPNIIIIGYSYPGKSYGIAAVQKGLSSFENINAIGLDFYQPENMTKEVELLGKILGKEAEAEDFLSWHNEQSEKVANAVAGLNKPKVYVEWSSTGGIGALSTLGVGSGFDGVLREANGFNIAKDLNEAYPKVTWEWILTQSPEAIIVRQTQPSGQTQMGWEQSPSSDTVKLEAVRNEVLARAGASGLPAVKSGKIFVIDWSVMNGLNQEVGATYLAKLLHPEADLDPVSVHTEYLKRLGLDMPEGRTFVYPELSGSK